MKATVMAVGLTMLTMPAMAQSMVYGPSYDHGQLADNESTSVSSSAYSNGNQADVTVTAPDGTSCTVQFRAAGNHKVIATSDCSILTTPKRGHAR